MPGRLVELSPAINRGQRWRDGLHTWRRPTDGGFNPAAYSVERIDERTAKRFVIQHHYAASYPAASKRYGLLLGDQLVGVAVLSIPVRTSVLTSVFPELEPFKAALELGRFVLLDACPFNSESWFLGRMFTEAAADGIRGLVSFADPVPRRIGHRLIMPGHVGTIYQATNATYLGRGTVRSLTLLPTGEILNDRSKQKVRKQERGHDHVERKLVALGARPLRSGENPTAWLHDALAAIGARRLRHNGNHRFAFALGNRAERRRTRIAGTVLPYPKERDAA